MKTPSSLAVSLLLVPALVAAQPWGADLNRAVLDTRSGNGGFRFQKVNLKDDDEEMINLVEKTAPAVVMIIAKGKPGTAAPARPNGGLEEQGLEDFLEKFFRMPKQAPTPNAPEKPQDAPAPTAPKAAPVPTSSGSGVIVNPSGRRLIVTNAHVVEAAGAGGTVELQFHDGSKGSGKVLGYNEKYDLALVEPESFCKTCGTLKLANSGGVRVGQVAIAIGSPFGLDQTVTIGHVSYLGRDIGAGGVVADFIQTDASINPGNSGGALVNRLHELVGINTAIYSRTGSSAGIGFATPSNHVAALIDRFAKTGVISPSRIGAPIMSGPNGGAVSLNADPDAGSPAAKAGLKKDDVILQIDGETPKSSADMVRIITNKVPAKPVTLKIQRGSETLDVTVTVESLHP